MKIWKNLKWLFNHPPTSIMSVPKEELHKCDYCGEINSYWNFGGYFTICFKCMKKALDKILKKEEK